MTPPDPDDLTHDISSGVLNGVTFYDWDGVGCIDPMPCETCGASIFIGVIHSPCGLIDRDIWELNADGDFVAHQCGTPPESADTDMCEVCYPDEEDDDESAAMSELDELCTTIVDEAQAMA